MARQRNAGQPGTGTGTTPPPDDDGDDADLVTLVNAAVSSQLTRRLPQILAGVVGPAITQALEPLQQQLAAFGGGQQGQPGQGQPGQQPGAGQGQQQTPQGGQPPVGGSPEMQAMQREMAELRGKLKASEDATQRQAREARETARDAQLADQLGRIGVDKNRSRGAVAVLRDQLVYDETAKAWKYRAQRDGFTEDLDIAAGVKEWGGTDEGKSYIAPQQGRGGGAGTVIVRPAGGIGGQSFQQQRTGTPPDPKADKAARQRAATDQLFQLTAGMLSGGTIQLGGTGGEGGGGNGNG